ncbi:hypothetical protein [Luteibacter sp. Lutesp34]|uniref:hypothetical protein n=1 Tax=Luteibacter sp. Lutesp34 TaxID=3243030 RepID=UPI0039B631B9
MRPAPLPAFGETDCRHLVAATQSGVLDDVSGNPLEEFCAELEVIKSPHARFINKAAWRRHIRGRFAVTGLPAFMTFLKTAYTAGVEIVDILSDPKGAAQASGQLIFDGGAVPSHPRDCHRAFVHVEIFAAMEKALRTAQLDDIPSLRTLAAGYGVSVGYIRHRFPDLLCRYVAHRSQIAALERYAARRRSREVAREMSLWEGHGLGVTNKDLEKQLSLKAKCSVVAAREAIKFVSDEDSHRQAHDVSFGDMLLAGRYIGRMHEDTWRRRVRNIEPYAESIWHRPSLSITSDEIRSVIANIVAQEGDSRMFGYIIGGAYAIHVRRIHALRRGKRSLTDPLLNPAHFLYQARVGPVHPGLTSQAELRRYFRRVSELRGDEARCLELFLLSGGVSLCRGRRICVVGGIDCVETRLSHRYRSGLMPLVGKAKAILANLPDDCVRGATAFDLRLRMAHELVQDAWCDRALWRHAIRVAFNAFVASVMDSRNEVLTCSGSCNFHQPLISPTEGDVVLMRDLLLAWEHHLATDT